MHLVTEIHWIHFMNHMRQTEMDICLAFLALEHVCDQVIEEYYSTSMDFWWKDIKLLKGIISCSIPYVFDCVHTGVNKRIATCSGALTDVSICITWDEEVPGFVKPASLSSLEGWMSPVFSIIAASLEGRGDKGEFWFE